MSREERVKEIRKAIELLGWIEVGHRVKSYQDKEIFSQLSEEFDAFQEASADKILKKHHIEF